MGCSFITYALSMFWGMGGNSDIFEGTGRANCQEKVSGQQRTARFPGDLAVSGLRGPMTTVGQCGECPHHLEEPGARQGEEQVTHAKGSAGVERAGSGRQRRPAQVAERGTWGCATVPVCTRDRLHPRAGTRSKADNKPSKRDVKPGPPPSPDCVGSRPRKGHGAKNTPISIKGASEGNIGSKCYLNPVLVNFWLVP